MCEYLNLLGSEHGVFGKGRPTFGITDAHAQCSYLFQSRQERRATQVRNQGVHTSEAAMNQSAAPRARTIFTRVQNLSRTKMRAIIQVAKFAARMLGPRSLWSKSTMEAPEWPPGPAGVPELIESGGASALCPVLKAHPSASAPEMPWLADVTSAGNESKANS